VGSKLNMLRSKLNNVFMSSNDEYCGTKLLTFFAEFMPDGLRSKLNKCDLAFKVEHVAFKVEQ
jgi:hypothetical protein